MATPNNKAQATTGVPKTAAGRRSTRRPAGDELTVVGIGASAGGLEALRELFPTLPVDAKVTYVVAQHLDSKHRSMLVDLLKSHTRMDVVEAKNNHLLRPKKVYIAPPGRNVAIADGRLKLTDSTGSLGPKPSVDEFFISLAEEKGEKAVGIILSGTGSDGALGIRAIKAQGGFTMAQAVESAKFDGMPHAAISMGNVDLVLRPERLGEELLRFLRQPVDEPLTLPEDETPDDVQRILRTLQVRTGCDFTNYKPSTLNRRIQRRMAINKMLHLADYAEYVGQSSTEPRDLCRDILLSVTSFFRDPDAFRALEDPLQKIVESKAPGDPVRIWIPGCATGEEAYSIAILLDRILGNRRRDFDIQMFGTDLDEDAILHARNGVYSAASVANVRQDLLREYFDSTQNMYQVTKSIRDMVVFARQDLVRDPPFSHLELVSCRNLLIYFSTRLQDRILPVFHQVIEPGGYLFLGKSESILKFDELFEVVDKKAKIFKRRPGPVQARLARGALPYRGPLAMGLNRRQGEARGGSFQGIMNQTLADAYAPCAVLVDDRMQMRHVRGDVSPYLRLSPGEVDLKITRMAQERIRLDLDGLLYRVARDQKPMRSRKLHLGDGHFVTLHAHPIESGENHGRLLALVFEEESAEIGDGGQKPVVDMSEDSRVRDLQRDLMDTREQLQTTVEELETTNEELQATNEELQSANEELHSANEELETSNEELQSTNEELRTVNEALHIKSAELSTTNTDLENVLRNVRSPMLVVDKALRITRVTPFATDLFEASELSIGQVVTSVPCKFSLPTLREDVLGVIQTENVLERDVTVDERSYWMRVLPYYSEKGESAGAIVLFLDQTAIRAARSALREREARLGAILDNALFGVIAIDETGNMQLFNKAAERIFGYISDEVLGQNVSMLMPEPHRSEHPGYIARYLKTGHSELIGKSRKVTALHRDGSEIEVDITLTEMIEDRRRTFIGLLYSRAELSAPLDISRP